MVVLMLRLVFMDQSMMTSSVTFSEELHSQETPSAFCSAVTNRILSTVSFCEVGM